MNTEFYSPDTSTPVIILALLAGFAVIHTLTAGEVLKARIARVLGERLVEGWYRLAYNLLSMLSVAPALLAAVWLPDGVVYELTLPWIILARFAQLVAVVGLAASLLKFDIARFMGLAQVAAYFAGTPLPLPPEPLSRSGIFRFSRHPLYFFSMLLLWVTPTMSLNGLVMTIGFSIYFVVGSLVEERRLLETYGEEYADYQRRTSWLIPWKPRSK